MIWTCVSVGSGNASMVRFLNANRPAARSTAVSTKVAMRWEREKSSRRSSIECAARHGSCHEARGERLPAYSWLARLKCQRHKKRSGHNSTRGEITRGTRRKILRKPARVGLRRGRHRHPARDGPAPDAPKCCNLTARQPASECCFKLGITAVEVT